MKAPFPALALTAFLLLLVASAIEPFELPFVPHAAPGVLLLLYIFGGVIGSMLADYQPHYSHRVKHERPTGLRPWFHR
jgi:hypothetical protein